jgi:hypothetical protein
MVLDLFTRNFPSFSTDEYPQKTESNLKQEKEDLQCIFEMIKEILDLYNVEVLKRENPQLKELKEPELVEICKDLF